MAEPKREDVALPDREEYGPVASTSDAAPPGWDEVTARLEEARYFWMTTVRADGRPHAIPVCGLWREDRLYFSSHPATVTARNVVGRDHVRAHLESAREPIIIDGEVRRLSAEEVDAGLIETYHERFGLRLDPRDPEMPWFVLSPQVVLAWRADDIRNTSVRWHLT